MSLANFEKTTLLATISNNHRNSALGISEACDRYIMIDTVIAQPSY
jgi:hypothetical protein